MRVLVTGGHGQLGRAIAMRGRMRGHEIIALGSRELNVCEPIDLPPCDAVINAAAYTAVDRAESNRDQAFAVNRDGAENVALACLDHDVPLLHVSTDYVFDGTATCSYREDTPTTPLNVYGESKAAGERAVLRLGACVVRTSWLFAEGGPSFVHKILQLARIRTRLRVVSDQQGCPTYGGDLADALLMLVERPDRPIGIYHYCNDGPTTWHDFAKVIVEAIDAGVSLEPTTMSEYPTPAHRPACSILDTSRARTLGIATPSWRDGLARVIADAQHR